MNTFGAYVRAKREAADISLTEFARRLGISPAYWSRIETGRELPPKNELIEKAAEILEINSDELFVQAVRLPPDLQGRVGEVVQHFRKIKNAKD